MNTSGSPRQRWNLAFMGNAVVMLVLAAIAWLFAGLHEGDGWLASPSRDRASDSTPSPGNFWTSTATEAARAPDGARARSKTSKAVIASLL